MARLRNVLIAMAIAVVLGTGAVGCHFAHWSPFHCDDCDDFPAPAYGPDFSMMPGSYTGLPPADNTRPSGPGAGASTAPSGAAQPSAGGPSRPVEEAPPPAPATSPPAPPSATPGLGAAVRN